MAAIEAHVRDLDTRLIAGAHDLGATVVTPDDPALRGPLVCIASSDVGALVAELAAEHVTVSSRDGNLRVAAHLYNTEEDVDRLLAALAARPHLLA